LKVNRAALLADAERPEELAERIKREIMLVNFWAHVRHVRTKCPDFQTIYRMYGHRRF